MARTLLVVDDIKVNREILKKMLGGEYQILEAEHGQEALAVMAAKYQQLSAVLLDLGMPVMDGYEVLSIMQGDEKLSQLPVIVTTGQTDSGSEEKALRLGAKDYISKPYKSAIIKQRIWNTINLRETAATVNALRLDRLTGLYSRDAFLEKAGELVSARAPGHYVMACFDIDQFKVVNDQYGTEKGDEVLRHIARVFRSGFEPIGGICCRVSSDDFVALYPSAYQDSEQVADIRRRAALVPGLASPLAFCVGRYVVDDPAMAPSGMYDRAMMAAASVKGRYDEKIGVYDESMRARLIHEQQIVTEMESALNARQFEVWYQPQYNHSTGAMIGAEALVRWRHPDRGMISPGVFIPVFEQNGFIYSLDCYVWEEVCRFLRQELDAGRSPLPVSVNISRYDVFRPDLVEFILGLTGRYGIPVELLRLEITESAFAESTHRIVTVVQRLIDCGFTLEIDDFGSGYSSLNTLKSVPAQVVKLDMRFLEDDDDAQRGGNILESVVRMTKWLGMSVIAEGVERKAQADYLRSIGCNYVQGYLYARPMAENDYRELAASAGKEEKLLALETVENLDNNAFWNPESMDTLIFNSYIGAACIYECKQGQIEMLRATDKFVQALDAPEMTVADALKLDWLRCFDGDSARRLLDDVKQSLRTGREVTGEYALVGLPGRAQELDLRSTLRVIASAGERCLVYCTSENVTAQRKAERREREASQQLRAIMSNVACGITAVALRGESGEEATYILTNDRFYELLGYTKQQFEEEIGAIPFAAVLDEDRQRVAELAAQVDRSGVPQTTEYRAVRRDGRLIWVSSNLSSARFNGVEGRIQLGTYTDITEQKQAALALEDTTKQLQTMMDDIPGGYVRIRVFPDESMRPVYFNDGFCRLTGMSRGRLMEFYATDAMAGVHPDDYEIVRNAFDAMLNRGEAHSCRYRLLHQDGGYVWLHIFGRATTDAAGDVYLSIYYTDAAGQVREEERQKELLDNLPYGVALYENDGGGWSVVHHNRRYWELVGRPETDYAGMSFLDEVYPGDREIIARELDMAIREDRDVACDIRVRYGDDDYRPFHVVGRILRRKDGGCSVYAAFMPLSNEAMSVQEMLPIALSAMMESQTDYSFVKDGSLRYICCSREAAKLAGLSRPADVLGKSDYELFDRAQADAFAAEDRRVLESGEAILENTARLVGVDGAGRYASTSKYPLRDSQGNIVGVYGVGRDVTESRQLQSRFELLTNSIPGGIATFERDAGALRITYFNDGFCRLFELSREECAQICRANIFESVFEEDLPLLLAQMEALFRDNTPVDCECRVRLKDGRYKWIGLRATAQEREGERISFNAVLFDVTRRQEAAERLRISEEENRLALQHTRSAVCRYSVAEKTLSVPEASQRDYMLPERIENVPEGQVADGVIAPESAETYLAFYQAIRGGSRTGTATFRRMAATGWRWLEAHYSTIFSGAGEPVYAIISYLDVTEQREKDSAYKRWQQSFRSRPPESYALFRCGVRKTTRIDAQAGTLLAIDFAPGDFDFDGHTAEYAAQYVLEDDRERFSAFLNVDALLAGYYQGKRTVTLEYREAPPGGGDRWLRLTVDLLEHATPSDIEAYLLFEDIDQSKRRELTTIEQAKTDPLTGVMNRNTFAAQVNHLLQTAKPGAHHALMMLDMDGFKLVNDVFGHGTGDQALVDVAASLRTALRHDDLLGRLGGDEFLVFLPNIAGDVIAATKAKQLCALTRKSFSVEVEISGSIGIAAVPRDGTDFETLYKKADAALYHVKGSGKDNFAFYQDEMEDEHLALEEKPGGADEPSKPAKKRRMLIVDDSRIDHAMLANIFAGEFIIEKAKDGGSALVRLRHYGSAISVVLLDLMMPGLDGFAVLKKMQESAELRSVPVVVVSGDGNLQTSLRAIRAGAVDFVNKPVDPDVLRIRVQSAIRKAENERLRAKNSQLEYQNSEVLRYRTALESSGVTVIENDWVAGTFVYDAGISLYLAGTYDQRGLWHILLSDLVAETKTVQRMQELVQEVAADRRRRSEQMLVQLKTPSGARHWFRLCVYKLINEFGLAGKIYLTLIDLGAERPALP